MGTNGQDGTYAYYLSFVYDLIKETCNDKEKNNYEKNILEQVAYLGLNDDSINNKAVYNFKGVALVGLAINNIQYIRFGLNQFIKAINEYFLKDGGTSESAAYSIMTIGGLNELGYAFKNYSDPEDYIPPEGEIKYKNFNSMVDTKYYESFQYLIWTTYSNYYFPSIADSYNTTKVSDKLIELINYCNPVEKEFLKERMNESTPIYFSLFLRNSEEENKTIDRFIFPDIVFPFLSQGFIRTGDYGEKSLIVLDASNYGSHHHQDSLNLVFWKEGHELLVDLGYLWDHVNASETRHTYRHNTVYVNDKNQITNGRNGSFSTFFNSSKIKIMQASSNAYKECDVYNRTIIQIEHENNNSYFIDIFRVHGGRKRQYTFHGPNNNYILNSDLQFNQLDEEYVPFIFLLNLYQVGYIEIKDVVLTEDNNPNNLLSPFPENYNKKPCPDGYTWCHYVGDGRALIEVNNTFKLTSVSSNPNSGVNVGICIGNSDGYRVNKNTFRNKISQKFNLKFKLRGSVLPVLFLLYWDDDDANTRRYYRTPDLSTISEEFTEYSFEFILGEEKYIKFKKYGITNKSWNITWNISDDYIFNVFFPQKKNQKVYFESGFGQREYKNTDYGVKLPYFYIDGSSDYNNYSTFVAVYEAHNKSINNTVNSVEIDDKLNGNIGIKIKTEDGDDYILSTTDNNNITSFNLTTDSTVYVKITNNEKNKQICIGGTFCESIKNEEKEFNGFTKGFNNEGNNSYFEIETKLKKENIIGQSLQIIGNDSIVRSYPIFHVEKINNGLKIYTRYHCRGFRVYENANYRIQNAKIVEEKNNDKKNEEENKKLSGFVIFLIVFGCILFIAIIIYLLYRCYKRKASGGMYLSDNWFKKLV